MTAVLLKALANLRTRRLQTGIIAVIILLSSGAAALALNLLVESSGPYDRAFEAQRGAHVLAFFDSRLVANDQLSSTPNTIGATASAGPWSVQELPLESGSNKFTLQVVGRADPEPGVANLKLVSGRWVTGGGEIVLTQSFGQKNRIAVGDTVTALSLASKPALRVVGEVVDIMEGDAQFSGQSAWVMPDELVRLSAPDPPGQIMMAYRFPGSPTDSELAAATQRLNDALPTGAVTGSVTYNVIRQVFDIASSLILSFLIAFSLFMLAACAAIVFNTVTGAVLAGYREIGVLRALGFTPRQAASVFVVQMLLAALAGSLVGIALGMAFSQPLIGAAAGALGLTPTVALSPLAVLGSLVGVMLVVAVAAIVPARRAARLPAVVAIRMGSGPANRPSTRLARAMARLPLHPALGLGAAGAVGRPLRATLTVLAVVVSVAALTFAYGSLGTIDLFTSHWALSNSVQVTATRVGSYPDAQAQALFESQPGTANVVATTRTSVNVQGMASATNALAMRGDSGRLGYRLIQGRWFQGPGEVVTQAGFLKDSNHKLGDTMTANIGGAAVQLRIVGVDFEVENFGHLLLFDWTTYQQAVPTAKADTYLVQLQPGTDAAAYVTRAQAAEPDFLSVQVNSASPFSTLAVAKDVVLALAVVLAVIGIVSVFNTVLLNTKERLQELGIFKAVGMLPRQVLVMVAGSALLLGIVGGIVGLAAGMFLHRALLVDVGALIGTEFPSDAFAVFPPLAIPLLAVAGVAVAVLGSLAPASWAIRASVAQVLRSE